MERTFLLPFGGVSSEVTETVRVKGAAARLTSLHKSGGVWCTEVQIIVILCSVG